MRGIPQIHFGFGVDGDKQGILAVIRRSVDLLKVAEICPELSRRDGVRFLDLFQWLGLLYPVLAVTKVIQYVADGFFAISPVFVRDKGEALPLAVMRVFLNAV